MTNLMLCTGAYAVHPYDWEQIGARVHSMEELCFYIVRNRYLLTRESFSQELTDWIGTECALPELARSLQKRFSARASAAELAVMILEYVRFNSPEEIEETKRVLRESTDMDVYEKSLARADFLMESQHFHQAIDAYEDLRRATPAPEEDKHAHLLYCEGVMNARMFRFAQAAESFRASYEISRDPEAYLGYLAALRMQMTEKEYLEYLSEDPKGYQMSMTLEERISKAEEGYGLSDAFRRVRRLKTLKNEGRSGEYYAAVSETVKALKDDYRGTRDVLVTN